MLPTLAWRNLWRNKRRTFISMGSVFFAVILAMFIMSLKEGVYEIMIKNVANVYVGYAQIHKAGYWEEQMVDNSFGDQAKIEKYLQDNPDIVNYVTRVESFALTASSEMTKGAMIVGTIPETEDQLTGLKDNLIAGEYLEANDSAVLLSAGLADYLKLGVGDELVIIGQGYRGSNAAGRYLIKGIVAFGSPDLNKRLVYLPLAKAQHLFRLPNRLTAIVLLLKNPGDVEGVVKDVQKYLGEEYEVMSWKELMPELNEMIESDKVEGYVFNGILYMLIAFGIFGTVLMMVAERQHEFGVLVAIGMKRFKLAWMVFLEVAIISLLGAISGIIAGLPLIIYFRLNPIKFGEDIAKMYEDMGFEPVFITSLNPGIFAQQATIVLILAIITSLYAVQKILRMDAVASMRQ